MARFWIILGVAVLLSPKPLPAVALQRRLPGVPGERALWPRSNRRPRSYR